MFSRAYNFFPVDVNDVGSFVFSDRNDVALGVPAFGLVVQKEDVLSNEQFLKTGTVLGVRAFLVHGSGFLLSCCCSINC